MDTAGVTELRRSGIRDIAVTIFELSWSLVTDTLTAIYVAMVSGANYHPRKSQVVILEKRHHGLLQLAAAIENSPARIYYRMGLSPSGRSG